MSDGAMILNSIKNAILISFLIFVVAALVIGFASIGSDDDDDDDEIDMSDEDVYYYGGERLYASEVIDRIGDDIEKNKELKELVHDKYPNILTP